MHIDDLERAAVAAGPHGGDARTASRSRREEQLRILTRLTDAVIFEEFIQKKFTGRQELLARRGREPDSAAGPGDREGRRPGRRRDRDRHGPPRPARTCWPTSWARARGRSSASSTTSIPSCYLGRGDVKYHLGYSSDWMTAAGHKVHLSLCFNPSHLEFVNPVAIGPRAGQAGPRAATPSASAGMALLIHGDAAFAGEGVVQETLNLSQLAGYRTGGTLHVVVNNQIGFTTTPHEGRSTHLRHRRGQDAAESRSSTSTAKIPRPWRRSCGWRWTSASEFQRDVVIDMYCYRRRGHNEGDEPSFTQPLLYAAIDERKPRARRLSRAPARRWASITREEADRIADERPRAARARSSRDARKSDEYVAEPQTHRRRLEGLHGRAASSDVPEVETGVDQRAALASCSTRRPTCPPTFTPHPKIERLLEAAPRDGRAASSRSTGRPARRWPSPAWPTEGMRVRLTRPGQRARHVQPAPRRAARRTTTGTATCRCSTCRRRSGAGRDRQQPALARPACWASSTATASTAPTAW